MAMDKICCWYRVFGGQPLNPTSAKTGQIWGTRHLLRIEILLLAAIRLIVYPGVCEKCGLRPIKPPPFTTR